MLIRTLVIGGAALVLGVTLVAAERPGTVVQPQPGTRAPIGSYLFKTYCASCHGTSARGDGPLADAMRRRPSDLTQIAKRNNGAFAAQMVYQIIDGRQPVRGHGGPDMPVWGDAFLRTSDTADEASVQQRIQALVDYLESIQARDTD